MTMSTSKNDFFPCFCCGAKVLGELGGYEICDLCGWEDDPVQSSDPDFEGGANVMSLNQARDLHQSVMHKLDKLVKGFIQPILKSSGFRKNGLKWNRDRGEFVDVVTVQTASYSTEESITCTVNLGVAVPEFQKIIWTDKKQSWLIEADCPVRIKLGDLIQDKHFGGTYDRWWNMTDPSQDFKRAGTEIHFALQTLGIPFLERFDNFGVIADYLGQLKGWQAKNVLMSVYRALAEWKNGSSDTAFEILAGINGGTWEIKAKEVRKQIEEM